MTWLRRRWRYLMHHARIGLHSNFPTCCVLWFSLVWLRNPSSPLHWSPPRWWKRYFKLVERRYGEPDGINYIPCPLCILLRRRRQVHWCTSTCPI